MEAQDRPLSLLYFQETQAMRIKYNTWWDNALKWTKISDWKEDQFVYRIRNVLEGLIYSVVRMNFLALGLIYH